MMRTVMWILVLSCAGTCFAAPEFHYLSYLGGDGDDGLSRVHLDGAGFLVAIATSSSDLVTTAGAFMPSPVPETPTSSDVYLASFAPDHQLLAATFLGAPLADRPLLLTRLPGGDVLLVMNSTMESLPVDMHHMLDDSYHHDSNEDLLIVRMLPDLTAPRWIARVEGGSSGADLSAGVVDGDRLLLSWAAACWRPGLPTTGPPIPTTTWPSSAISCPKRAACGVPDRPRWTWPGLLAAGWMATGNAVSMSGMPRRLW